MRRGDSDPQGSYVPNMLEDERFKECLLARSGIRFYAGAPLTTRQGHTLGSFCVLDNKPRELTAEQLGQLEDMAAMVMALIGDASPFSGVFRNLCGTAATLPWCISLGWT